MSLPRVGISACLLGERVRYDGGHKLQPGMLAALDGQVEWVPVCPEVGAGLGTPRPPMHLRAGAAGVRVVTFDDAHDHTDALDGFAAGEVDRLRAIGVCGFVLKSRSPSCGPSVLVFGGDAPAAAPGRFADALARRLPALPLADEEDLGDPARCAAFLGRVADYRRTHLAHDERSHTP